MPQISKGGKYVFGWSRIGADGEVLIPPEAMREYHRRPHERVILISGSRASGGFVVSKKSWLEESAISQVLTNNPELTKFQIEEGRTIKFKGRLYGWARIHDNGLLILPAHTLATFQIKPGDCLLSIRGSDIAFVMGVKGPLIEKARLHPEINMFGRNNSAP